MTPSFEWVGGHPALDFLNTVSWRERGPENERLMDYAALVEWTAAAGLTDTAAARAVARESPDLAGSALRDALGVRTLLHDLFLTLARRGRAPAMQLAAVNALLQEAASKMHLAQSGDRFHRTWRGAPLDAPIGSVLWAAADLLQSPRLADLKACENPQCGWLFLDGSRRQNRRWCTMKECGSRAKARRFRQRQKAREAAGSG